MDPQTRPWERSWEVRPEPPEHVEFRVISSYMDCGGMSSASAVDGGSGNVHLTAGLVIQELDSRSRKILSILVDEFVRTGEPVGSRSIARKFPSTLSATSVRNIMSDLEDAGLIAAPHTSAGRQPTDLGLRLFVEALLEVGDPSGEDRAAIAAACQEAGRNHEEVLEAATNLLSDLTHHAGVVVAPKMDTPYRHIEFVSLSADRALVIVVHENGMVENRIIQLPSGVTPSTLVRAGNYLSARLAGRTFTEAVDEITRELDLHEAELDTLSRRVVEAGIATWTGDRADDDRAMLIVRGQANLLDDIKAMDDLERIRDLLDKLDQARHMMQLIDLTQDADGVSIFIGADNDLFRLSGCATIVAPVTDASRRFIGTLGVIGPTRMNYARIIPMVDYTARVVGRLLS